MYHKIDGAQPIEVLDGFIEVYQPIENSSDIITDFSFEKTTRRGHGIFIPYILPREENFEEFRSDLRKFIDKWYSEYIPSIEKEHEENGGKHWKRFTHNY
jgi:hypothetical protein